MKFLVSAADAMASHNRDPREMTLTIQGNRQRLGSLENCRFVEPEEFVNRATSRQPLLRVDDASANVHGLLDSQTGERFYIEAEKLERWQQVSQ